MLVVRWRLVGGSSSGSTGGNASNHGSAGEGSSVGGRGGSGLQYSSHLLNSVFNMLPLFNQLVKCVLG